MQPHELTDDELIGPPDAGVLEPRSPAPPAGGGSVALELPGRLNDAA